MSPIRSISAAGSTLTLVVFSAAASATTETPPGFDARIAGMAAGGVAIQTNGAALYHNPAALGGIDSLAITASVTPFFPTFTSPIQGPGTSTDSATQFAPLFLGGAGFRLTDQLVIGIGAYTTAGFGTTYELAAGDQRMSAFFMEVSPAIAYSPIPELSFGLGYRVSYASLSAELASAVEIPGQPPLAGRIEQDLSGFDWTGLHAGIHYRPNEQLSLGFSYKNKVVATLSGDVTANFAPFPELTQDGEAEFATPHRFAVGAAYSLAGVPLLLAASAKYLLYADANERLELETEDGRTTPIPLDWENVFGFELGAEYVIAEQFPVRLGYDFTQSATPVERPNPFTTPPGVLHGFHVGAGIRLESWDFDIAGIWAHGEKDVSADEVADATVLPGKYEMTTRAVALSVSYRR